jgi:hypothetical protein
MTARATLLRIPAIKLQKQAKAFGSVESAYFAAAAAAEPVLAVVFGGLRIGGGGSGL